jgi:hypothetical protein
VAWGAGTGHRVVEREDVWEPGVAVPGVAAGQVLAQDRRIDQRLPVDRSRIVGLGQRLAGFESLDADAGAGAEPRFGAERHGHGALL